MLQAGFIAAIAAHVAEALYACHVARALGCETWPGVGIRQQGQLCCGNAVWGAVVMCA